MLRQRTRPIANSVYPIRRHDVGARAPGSHGDVLRFAWLDCCALQRLRHNAGYDTEQLDIHVIRKHPGSAGTSAELLRPVSSRFCVRLYWLGFVVLALGELQREEGNWMRALV